MRASVPEAPAGSAKAPAGSAEAPFTSHEAPFTARDAVLYAVTVVSWSASWYALKVNAASFVAPSVSVLWRFVIAAVLMLAFVALTGGRLRFPARMHAAFAALGILIFSTNFWLFYHASAFVVSGLLAVVFSLASVINLLLNAARGDVAGARRWFGAALGTGGILLLYAPQIVSGGATWAGLALCVGGTLSFCLGNIVSQDLQRRAVPVLSASAWGMVYGAAWCAVLARARGEAFRFDPSTPYVTSLLFLALVSTVLAFWAYLQLVGRLGAGRAAYATVMFPIVALGISTFAEGYEWTPLAIAGVALALGGNLFVLRGGRRAAAPVAVPR